MMDVKYKGTYQTQGQFPEDYECWEIVGELPNDGTPGSEQKLHLSIEAYQDGHVEIHLSKVGYTQKPIGHFQTRDIDLIADLLYPKAGVRTVKTLISK